ncbi:MAG: 5-formyltetrahydrofolate cyclo-ligase [Myxococcales bacterium]|jgi:5-formyltetrahydrofolate cyclo-ligase
MRCGPPPGRDAVSDAQGEDAGPVFAKKREIRARIRAERHALSAGERSRRADQLARRLRALPEYRTARCIAGYVAFRAEMDPAALLDAALGEGKRVALPRVEGAAGVRLHEHMAGRELVRSALGILEPSPRNPTVDPAEVDLVLVPALAVDATGHRLGYGGGYYDRLLPTLPRAFSAATVHDFQVLPSVPVTHLDQRVDCIVTERRVLRIAPGAGGD